MDDCVTSATQALATIPGLEAVLGVRLCASNPAQPTNASRSQKKWRLVDEQTITPPGQASASTSAQPLRLVRNHLPLSAAGFDPHHTYSLALDNIGVYYDARKPSRLEHLIIGRAVEDLPSPQQKAAFDINDPKVLARARACIQGVVQYQSGTAPDSNIAQARQSAMVIVIDEARDEPRIAAGLAGDDQFRRMLSEARRDHPEAEILITPAPDGHSEQGHYPARELPANTRRLDPRTPVAPLIGSARCVYTVTSDLGLLALMQDTPLVCFGTPYYAGWGLSEDRGEIPERRGVQRSLEQVFAAAFFAYNRYIDPDLAEPCELERIIDHLQLQQTSRNRNASLAYGCGITWWKRHHVRHFVASNGPAVRFLRNPAQLPKPPRAGADAVFAWGYRDNDRLRATAQRRGYSVWRMEDGFLRSVGLGADLTAPASLVLDSRGIYFDGRQESDLEHILANHEFGPELVQRATRLIELLVKSGVSKYNVGKVAADWLPAEAQGKTVILVPGQVEGDASLQYGGQDIRTNARLLEAVRRNNPHAYIVYKPHPDIVTGNRLKDTEAVDTRDFDALIVDINISACLEQVDEVHTMTSLSGFEALLRNKNVVTYGVPFYAGWGLTRDYCPCPRRSRKLSLAELTAGAVILYPRYVNPKTGQFTTPEMIIQLLDRSRTDSAAKQADRGVLGRAIRTLQIFSRGVYRELRIRSAERSNRSRSPGGRTDS